MSSCCSIVGSLTIFIVFYSIALLGGRSSNFVLGCRSTASVLSVYANYSAFRGIFWIIQIPQLLEFVLFFNFFLGY